MMSRSSIDAFCMAGWSVQTRTSTSLHISKLGEVVFDRLRVRPNISACLLRTSDALSRGVKRTLCERSIFKFGRC